MPRAGELAAKATARVSLVADHFIGQGTGATLHEAEAKALGQLIVELDALAGEINSRIVEVARMYEERIK